MPTAAQRAQQERFARAAKQARSEGKKGKPFGKRVGELLRGRASHGAGHKTKSAARSAPSHGGGSTSEKSKPKPRVALYAGVAVGVLRAGGARTISSPNHLGQAKLEIQGMARDPVGYGTEAGIPAGVGALISWAADKIGLNKMLARARFPLRV